MRRARTLSLDPTGSAIVIAGSIAYASRVTTTRETTERALVANVAAAPDDDAPRLVYADWLSEQGDPRGELVVVQCALARADLDDAPESITTPLRERETALLAEHRDVWFEPLIEISVGTYLFRRGFIERHDVLQPSIDGARLHEAAPLLRAIRTSHVSSLADYADALPIHELTLYELADLGAARRACELAELANLRKLDLHFRNADADLSRESIAKHLSLERFAIHAPVVRAADPPMLLDEVLPRDRSRLRSLHFSRVRFDDLRPLGALAGLEELVLVGCYQLSLEQLAALRLPALRSLAITDRAVSTAHMTAILDAFPSLRRLRLSRASLDNATASAIAAHPNATSLRRLDVSNNGIGASGAHEIMRLQNLVTVDFANNPYDPNASERIRVLGRGHTELG